MTTEPLDDWTTNNGLIRIDAEDAVNAPVLSYNVPDPTSYPGRSYINLDFGARDPFALDIVMDPGTGRGEVVADRFGRGRGFLDRVPDGEAVGRLGPLRPPRVPLQAAGLRGRAPRLAMPLHQEALPAAAATALRAAAAGGHNEPCADGNEPSFGVDQGAKSPKEPPVEMVISRPDAGARYETPLDTLDLEIEVSVRYNGMAVFLQPKTVTVTVNGHDYEARGPVGEPRIYRAQVPVPIGRVSIAAQLTVHTGNRDWHFSVVPRYIYVEPAPETDPGAQGVGLTVTSPAEERVNVLLNGAETVTLEVCGSAQAPAGTAVECTVTVDGGTPQVITPATDGGFTAGVPLTPGEHIVVVQARTRGGPATGITRYVAVSAGANPCRHRLMLVECLRLSTFPGRYGAGRVVQTMSLLPGEKTEITIRSFRSEASTSTQASSIFDSCASTVGDELTSAIAREDTTKSSEESEVKAQISTKAGGSWGWGSASVEAGLSYGTAAAREQLSRNVTNGASRHAAEKSAKRDVKVDTTTAATTTKENEQLIVRTLENTNHSRTLNFVFRQMTQEYISVLHLVDVRVAHLVEEFEAGGGRAYEPDPADPSRSRPRVYYEETTLAQLPAFLERICASPEQARHAESTILRQLDAVFDYCGELRTVVSDAVGEVPVRSAVTGELMTRLDNDDPDRRLPVTEEIRWHRFDPALAGTWPVDAVPGDDRPRITVPGVILAVTANTLRTDSIVVDAFVGGGQALDRYSTELQRTAIAARRAEAARAQAEAAKIHLGLDIVAGAEDRTAAYAALFAPAPERVTANGNG